MKKLILSVLMAFCTTMLLAQPITVKGTVISSEDGLPVIGAYVLEQGTNNGTSTDVDGNFVITVPKLATLVVKMVGFHDYEVQVQGRSIVNISLAPESVNLDEVMVVAYGTVKKGSYSGSATVVKQDAMKDAPVVSFESVLAGKAPGVQVASFSGQPGAQADISIRGFGSFNAGNAPLYVIDGVPATSGDWASGNMSTSAMSYLNPSDIESITVLKDAAAASLYGSRASNGVILITTKKGKQGKLTSTFKASAGFSYFAYDNYPLASDAQMEELHRQSWYNYGEENPSEWNKSYSSLDAYAADKVEKYYPKRDYDKYIYRDWEDVLFRTGIAQNYEYSVSGGGEKGRIYASVAYTDQQGVVSIDNLQRFSTTINGETNLNKYVKVGANFQYSWQFQEGHQEGVSTKDNPFFIWKVVLNPRWPYAYKETGELYLERWNSSYSTINPVASYDAQINDAKQNRLIMKGYVEVKPTDYLTLKTTLSSDWLYVHDRFGWLYGHPNYTAYGEGYMSDRHRNINRMVSSTTINFDKTWGDHHVSALAGWEAEEEKYHMTRIGKIDFSYAGATESIFGTNYEDGYSYSREEGLLSALGSLSYDYKSKYYLTGTYRRDGSSRLAPDTRWGDFWSVSGSWRFSNEKFLEDVEWLNDGKLRASYGTSGTLPSNYFGYMSVYDFTQYGSAGASYPSNLANTDLTWEKNKNWNVAVDATIFDKYNFSIEYYEKKTTDLLLDAKIPSTTGFTTTLTNIGSMQNKGWEIAVNVNVLDKKDIGLSVGANWSTVDNKVLALSEEGETQVSNRQIWKAGYCIYQYYTRDYLGVNKENGLPMYARGTFHEGGKPASELVTLKNGTVIEKGETVPYDTYNYTAVTGDKANNMILDGKTSLPKGFGGFNVDFRYKNWSLVMAWSYKYGNYIWDDGTDDLCVDGYYWSHRNMLASEIDTWSPENPNGSIPKRVADYYYGGYIDSDRAIHKGDFLRLKNLTVSYSLPKSFTKKMNISNARVYAAGANLLTFSKLHIDPEIQSDGYFNFHMPAMRTVTLGLEVSF